MPYSFIRPGRIRLEDEKTGNAYLFVQYEDDFLWCNAEGYVLQVLSCVKFGTLADRPAAGKVGRLYFATDTKEFFYDNRDEWVRVVSGETGLYDADRDTYIDVEPSSDADKIVGYTAGTQVLNISSAGILTFPKQSACVIARTTDAQSITANTWTKVDYDTVVLDIQNEANLTDDRITVTEDGIYLIAASTRFDVAAAGDWLQTRILKNTNVISETHLNTADADFHTLNNIVITQLSAGDYIEVHAININNDDSILYGEHATYLCVVKIA